MDINDPKLFYFKIESLSKITNKSFHVIADTIFWHCSPEPEIDENKLKKEMLTLIKNNMKYIIIEERNRRLMEDGLYALGHWFQTDANSRTQRLGLFFISLVTKLENLGIRLDINGSLLEGIEWSTMDKTFVTINYPYCIELFKMDVARDKKIFTVANNHIEKMEQSEDPYYYDYSKGWPQSFKEYQAIKQKV